MSKLQPTNFQYVAQNDKLKLIGHQTNPLRRVGLLRAFLMIVLLVQSGYGATNPIRLNTVGFLPHHEKRASVATRCSASTLIDSKDGGVVFRGKVTGPITNHDTNEALYIADFSTFDRPGIYRLDVAGVGSSATFSIN